MATEVQFTPEKGGGSKPLPSSGEVRTGVNGAVLVSDEKPADTSKEEKLLAGKYKTPEELEKAYKELEKKLGAPKEETPNEATPAKIEKKNELTPDQALQAAKDAGFNLDALADEFFKNNNSFTEDTLSKLEAKGISRDTVDQYVKGQQALAEKQQNEIASTFGGLEKMQSAFEWAASNLSQDDIDTYNAAFSSADLKAVKMAAKALQSEFVAANGSQPKLVTGGETVGAGGAVGGYTDQSQMLKDMSDPRYKAGDKAFHAQVQQKIANASW
jgi:hypothetical protein